MGVNQSQPVVCVKTPVGPYQYSQPVCVKNPTRPYQYSPSDTFATDELLECIYDEIKPQLEKSARNIEMYLLNNNQVFWYDKNILRVFYTENGMEKITVLSRDQHVKYTSKLVKIPWFCLPISILKATNLFD